MLQGHEAEELGSDACLSSGLTRSSLRKAPHHATAAGEALSLPPVDLRTQSNLGFVYLCCNITQPFEVAAASETTAERSFRAMMRSMQWVHASPV